LPPKNKTNKINTLKIVSAISGNKNVTVNCSTRNNFGKTIRENAFSKKKNKMAGNIY
jgi:hypothetical protein